MNKSRNKIYYTLGSLFWVIVLGYVSYRVLARIIEIFLVGAKTLNLW